jgi:hypothetical protein
MAKTKLDVIIIGAPRSGTNMLRDILTSFPDVCTWPCDEINYIWRYGNRDARSDELVVDMLNPKIKKYILDKFEYIRKKSNCSVVVEKTCANSLRVPFVHAILPDAKYIFITRDGIDAAGSAKERWYAKLDLRYIFSKARFVPLKDIPYYAFKYLIARFNKLISRERHLTIWGPVFSGMPSPSEILPLTHVCALQWQKCVELAHRDLSRMAEKAFIHIRYEDFVRNPVEECKKIVDFLGFEVSDFEIEEAVVSVSDSSLGRGRVALGAEEVGRIGTLIGDTLVKFDYSNK